MTISFDFDFDSIVDSVKEFMSIPAVESAISILTAVFAVGLSIYFLLSAWASSKYQSLKVSPPSQCDIDDFVDVQNNPPSTLKVVATSSIQLAGHQARTDHVIPLECTPSPHVDGLWVSRLAGSGSDGGGGEDEDGDAVVKPVEELLKKKGRTRGASSKPTVVVATLRMGFGHHRLAYSSASWCLEQGYTTIFHDFLNVDSEERDLMKSVDEFYSKMSRLASEWGGPIEKLWGLAMKQGDADGLRIAALTAAHLVPLLNAYPKDTPLITTHQVVALTAAAAGFTNVVNLVVDNYPQWFLVVPKVLNIVQGPVNYQSFLKMGVPADQLKLAGHWCPTELVDNIDVDCTRRIKRANESPSKKPRRLLIPVGGAGAQRAFIVKLIEALSDKVKDGQVQLFLNAGDHVHMKKAFVDVLTKCDLDYDTVTTTQGVRDFQSNLLNDRSEPDKAITLFAFDEYFPAVATTDILCRVADVLTCKPSELAFYPLPKLHIRRVGDHEADSARRAGELGCGTMEAREISDAMTYMDLFLQKPSDLLISFNEAVMTNNEVGIYDGCKNAVEFAVDAE
mmetsp:Transcript_32951/g.80094  ORF Transcript_32951/g.80094 Transcript_32951/m.80094 type:complete len:565 (+) Transcript_32951:489-2183(+)|eukprot:CAMPEP_0113455304 /NCGR_PEP_ID=MMETSP0014_2-20120614/8307_1 /TAXON_ID=2857 /ORGANISM="Nitzschia sp." /LENGTH=564 /DNA_ID=CAMNT_0000346731 /DNA_START=346 /DNA_END=2040 /DNA_ORIENTATION=+ /assembly_acc=CAM_ASM_000159